MCLGTDVGSFRSILRFVFHVGSLVVSAADDLSTTSWGAMHSCTVCVTSSTPLTPSPSSVPVRPLTVSFRAREVGVVTPP